MSADYTVHLLTNSFTKDDYKAFSSNHMNSEFFNLGFDKEYHVKTGRDTSELVLDTPSVYVGEVSWAKASLFEDTNSYVPQLVDKISDLFSKNELLVITDEIALKVENIANNSKKHRDYDIGDVDEIIEFFKSNIGETAFTVSW